VRQASAVKREWLDARLLVVRDDVTFDARSGGSSPSARTCWDDLVLDEVELGHVPDEQIAAALAAARPPKTSSPSFQKMSISATTSMRVPCARMPCPTWTFRTHDEQLKTLLVPLCPGLPTFDDLSAPRGCNGVKSLLTQAKCSVGRAKLPETAHRPQWQPHCDTIQGW